MNMKRRNADCGKLRRPLKRSKITEGIYGSTFLYVKFLMVWVLLLMADFILEFRFEYLWPFWLLVRSVYDSFKYQGLAFSVFFICIAVTSDVVCYLFIPVQWLFFAASTYVWVQYVWHTERGICLPTVSLWLLFVYIEASVRLRELKSLPYHLDLCRPFAAHCIGYPVVTLGFGFKSYVSYRMRVRKQKDVQKENDFYINLLQQALPPDQQQQQQQQQQQYNSDKQKAISNKEEVISNGSAGSSPPQPPPPTSSSSTITSSSTTTTSTTGSSSTSSKKSQSTHKQDSDRDTQNKHKSNNTASHTIEDYQFIEQGAPPPSKKHHNNVNDYDDQNLANDNSSSKSFKANGVTKATSSSSSSSSNSKLNSQRDNSSSASSRKGKNNNAKENAPINYSNNKDEVINRLESDVKRLKADLQCSRNSEQELRSQISNLIIGDKSMKSELYQLRQDNESLQSKLHILVTGRQQDKQNSAVMERKFQEERKARSLLENQLSSERKAKKAEEAAAARAVAMATSRSGECSDSCKMRRRDLETDLKQIRRDLLLREEQFRQLERETQSLRQYTDSQTDNEVLMSALSAMQDKNTHLENSLSAETRVKLDLFSALGDAKRQVEIQQALLLKKELEVDELKSKIAEVMALMPAVAHSSHYNGIPSSESMPLYISSKMPQGDFNQPEEMVAKSNLNPNASDYLPKLTQ